MHSLLPYKVLVVMTSYLYKVALVFFNQKKTPSLANTSACFFQSPGKPFRGDEESESGSRGLKACSPPSTEGVPGFEV